MKVLFKLFICVLLFVSCKDSCKDAPDISEFRKGVKLDRVDLALRNAESYDQVKDLLKKDKVFADFIKPGDMPFDEIAFKLYSLGKDTVFNQLYSEVDRLYSKNKVLESDLGDLFGSINYYFNDWKQPGVKTFVSGFGGYDLIQTKEMTLIGLDYFLGPKPKFTDQSFPSYILKYYTKEHLPIKVSMAISGQFNKVDEKDQTVLAHMLYYGKAYYFTKKMFPCVTDSVICEYSSNEIKLLEDDPAYIWSHFIDKALFYNNDREAIQKYIDDRPNVFEIGENCPGRIGRWLGYKIVESYMEENPEVSLSKLMSETDNKKIFNQSHYHPE